MTCLTRELKNSDSPLYQWFQSKQSLCANRLISNHNAEMNRNQIIKPSGEIRDFALLGTAFVYAFRWHLGFFESSFDQTIASNHLTATTANQLLSAKTVEEKAVACLIFAAFEAEFRSGTVHEIASVLMNQDNNKLKPELSYIHNLINDLVNLIQSISSVWDATDSNLTRHKYFLNPTFIGSSFINADAQQIVNGSLIKCFTTLKKHPLTRQHLWQQIAYVLLDWDNQYQINQVCWYYSRQKALFIYSTKSLFKDLPGLRTEFHDFLTASYSHDHDFCHSLVDF
ncbi:hypothetical protein [Pleurocapsa sp. PCC 7319]|uniref:hypothetical protein n=1 Tax=Pleurocapsa sp. PCC 7319 TaxID=118161 RepID=UPI000349F7A3|nr:hypothetical protein [Pleurocapsa sp. PCC 7319]